eukprot:6089935-Pyramimonas_sp.AAC.1
MEKTTTNLTIWSAAPTMTPSYSRSRHSTSGPPKCRPSSTDLSLGPCATRRPSRRSPELLSGSSIVLAPRPGPHASAPQRLHNGHRSLLSAPMVRSTTNPLLGRWELRTADRHL